MPGRKHRVDFRLGHWWLGVGFDRQVFHLSSHGHEYLHLLALVVVNREDVQRRVRCGPVKANNRALLQVEAPTYDVNATLQNLDLAKHHRGRRELNLESVRESNLNVGIVSLDPEVAR